MRYSIDYQQVSQGQSDASIDACPADIVFNSDHGLALIPCVGDVINLPSTAVKEGVCGIVRSRIFNYLRGPEELYCHVNILVERRTSISKVSSRNTCAISHVLARLLHKVEGGPVH